MINFDNLKLSAKELSLVDINNGILNSILDENYNPVDYVLISESEDKKDYCVLISEFKIHITTGLLLEKVFKEKIYNFDSEIFELLICSNIDGECIIMPLSEFLLTSESEEKRLDLNKNEWNLYKIIETTINEK